MRQSATIYFANVVTHLNTAIRFSSTQFDFHTVPFLFKSVFPTSYLDCFSVNMDNLLSYFICTSTTVELTAAALESQEMTMNYQISESLPNHYLIESSYGKC